MARTVKRKGPTKRVRLAAALREAMGPLMRAHGFDHPPKSNPGYSNLHPRADQWYRWVGDERQVVEVDWAEYSKPKFLIRWWDDSKLLESGHMLTFLLEVPGGRFVRPLGIGAFGGLWPISFTVRKAMERLQQLLTYWDTGVTSPRLGLDDPHRQPFPFKEWEPELPRPASEPTT
ncbi:hypothetical protein [Phenylobacterium sp.]|uniref:hypothetical protein n=1 Tax=Phenylobacterium sp. TaxID=1871053 RepID=UPI002C210431|nr:hypothetical protein [Phenylobacterium sp.]HVI32800.1 hypothetical protein [Phenylobacterium sp.]